MPLVDLNKVAEVREVVEELNTYELFELQRDITSLIESRYKKDITGLLGKK